jgi:exopolysaccharide production protein ExoY
MSRRYSGGAQARRRAFAKRSLDVVGALSFLILFAPLLAGIALLALAAQGRPVLFGHRRIGKNGETFLCFKFRTMVKNAARVLDEHLATNPAARGEWEAAHKLKDDPRVTPLGRVMRKLSIDELPQFFNVLRGDMSLVGPRPIVPAETRFYGPHIAEYHSVRPGITGLWQVSGRSNVSYDRRVELDVEYARDLSFRKDIIILVKTIPAVLSSEGSF